MNRICVFTMCLGLSGVLSTVVHAKEDDKSDAGLKGYCPASYLMAGKAVKGQAAHQTTYQGKVYHFANEAAKKAFEGEPEKYMPQFSGLCTVALGGPYGNRVAPDPKVFEVRDGKVYLFCAERAHKLFERDPQKYITKAVERFKTMSPDDPVIELSKRKPPSAANNPPQRKKRPALEMIGKPTPEATFKLAAGSDFKTQEMKEDAAVLMFYASWCGACKKTLPKLNELASSYAGKPVRFIGVSQDMLVDKPIPNNRRAVTKDYVMSQWKDFGVVFPQAFDPAKVGRTNFQVTSFPTMFLISKKSKKVEKVYIGGGAVMSGQLKRDIDAVLSEPSISQAPAESRIKVVGGDTLVIDGN